MEVDEAKAEPEKLVDEEIQRSVDERGDVAFEGEIDERAEGELTSLFYRVTSRFLTSYV